MVTACVPWMKATCREGFAACVSRRSPAFLSPSTTAHRPPTSMIRGSWQLRKLVISYCKSPSSKGVYELMKGNELIDFAKKNPQIEITAKLRPQKLPHVVGTYVEGQEQQISIKNANPQDIIKAMTTLRNRIFRNTQCLEHWGKPVTKYPSIQGKWIPSSKLEPDIVVKMK